MYSKRLIGRVLESSAARRILLVVRVRHSCGCVGVPGLGEYWYRWSSRSEGTLLEIWIFRPRFSVGQSGCLELLCLHEASGDFGGYSEIGVGTLRVGYGGRELGGHGFGTKVGI